MFSTFRALVGAVNSLNSHLEVLIERQGSVGVSQDRLTSLELGRAQFEADMEGILLKAEGQLKAARAAEARERSMRKSYEHLIDPFPGDSEEIEAPVREGYAPAEPEEGLQRVHVDVAPDYKTIALNRKFG